MVSSFFKFTLAVSLFLGWAGIASAQTYVLYSVKGKQVPQYYQLVQAALSELRENGSNPVILDLGNGTKIQVVAALGSGNVTQVFETANHLALRVPLKRGVFAGNTYVHYLQSYVDGMRKVAGILPVPQLYLDQSDPSRYLLQEKMNVRFSLHDFYTRSREELGLSEEEYAQIEKDLIETVKKAWPLKFVEDAHSGQFLLTAKGWVLADLERKVNLIAITAHQIDSREMKRTIFDQSFEDDIPEAKRLLLKNAVLGERTRIFAEVLCISKGLKLENQ